MRWSATNDYYPFGLTFNSYQRENSVGNRWKFQGQEHIDDLDLGWDSFKWRNHMPDIGRFFNVDPLAEKYVYNSPYAFSENKVTAHVELEGLESFYAADGSLVGVGPLTDEEAEKRGAVEYRVLSNETETVTTTENTFTDQELKDFSNWNQGTFVEGACLGYAARGSEMLTEGTLGWDTKSGNLNLAGKQVWNVGENLESQGLAVEIPITSKDPAGDIQKSSSDVGTENSAFLVGPGNASHSMISTYSGSEKTFSNYDQGTTWSGEGMSNQQYNSKVKSVNSFTHSNKIRAWRLQKVVQREEKKVISVPLNTQTR